MSVLSSSRLRAGVFAAAAAAAVFMGAATTTVAEPAAPAAAVKQDRRVNIINRSGHTIMEFYASSVGQNNWEEDILGSGVLGNGASIMINIDDGTGYCMYDLKAVFDDGDESVKYRVNVCEVSSVTYTG